MPEALFVPLIAPRAIDSAIHFGLDAFHAGFGRVIDMRVKNTRLRLAT
jgi:hypothetical protein